MLKEMQEIREIACGGGKWEKKRNQQERRGSEYRGGKELELSIMAYMPEDIIKNVIILRANLKS